MIVTSGPGFSLMQEGAGYASMTETPIEIVDIQLTVDCLAERTH